VLPGLTFHGRVLSFAPATGTRFSVIPPENSTGNFTKVIQRVPVCIQLEDDAAEPGNYASAFRWWFAWTAGEQQ
jgi:membrane fusion protein, multidrug efflux system